MRMTIKDIARLSGYGIGTVSRVLNNHPDVSEKARKKILSVIEENNFQPNSNARHLKMQSSSSVILIVKGTSNLLFADIVEQMQSLFLKNGENVSTYYIDDFPSPVPAGDGRFVKRDYDMSVSEFYTNVWWPDLLKLQPKGNRFLRW